MLFFNSVITYSNFYSITLLKNKELLDFITPNFRHLVVATPTNTLTPDTSNLTFSLCWHHSVNSLLTLLVSNPTWHHLAYVDRIRWRLSFLTVTVISNIVSHLVSLLFVSLGLFKSPPDPDDTSSSAANYILILDGASPSRLHVPVHVIIVAIKNKVPLVPYDDFVGRYGGSDEPVCTVYFECNDGCNLISEIVNCKHVFHRECLDKWVDVG
ncbi:putative Zinc finger, RING/FYVE/PHD-type [Helianthus anomalus]